MFLFGKEYILKYDKLCFSGQMSLNIISELLKNAPVLLKYLEPFMAIGSYIFRFSSLNRAV